MGHNSIVLLFRIQDQEAIHLMKAQWKMERIETSPFGLSTCLTILFTNFLLQLWLLSDTSLSFSEIHNGTTKMLLALIFSQTQLKAIDSISIEKREITQFL